MKKAFTLIELLAVIIILAVIALIATPVVLKVVDNAKESARKSSVSGYADTIRLALVEKQFETGVSPNINQAFLDSLSYQGEKVSCDEVINASKYGVVLHECNVGSDTNKYCFVMGKVYDCNDDDYKNIYETAKNDTDNENPDNETPEVGYKDNSGANQPELYDKMIPVVYNTLTSKWQYANINEKWYDYDLKEWANAVVLLPDKTYNIGQDIEMVDIAMMYVWIPRYKYTVFNGNNGSVVPQEIKIIFEDKKNSTGTVSCVDALNQTDSSGKLISEICTDETNGSIINGTSTYTHPAFTFGSKELTGIWVGKFEASTSDTTCLNNQNSTNCNNSNHTIVIKPNVDSLRYINVANFFQSMLNIKVKYGMNNVDSHMIKNMEWGAISYLANSKYGKCTSGTCEEVIGNNVQKNTTTYTTQTGCAAVKGDTNYSKTCTYQYNDLTNGVKASTTGTVYGIYDIAGVNDEYVMGSMVDSSGQFYINSSGFTNAPDSKYYDSYTYDPTSTKSHARGKLGDATKEPMNNFGTNLAVWESENVTFVINSAGWFNRGGSLGGQKKSANIFKFSHWTGNISSTIVSRSVIVAN